MDLISSLLNRDSVELPYDHFCDERFVNEVKSSLEDFASSHGYNVEESHYDGGVHLEVERTDIDYGPLGKVYGKVVETDLEFGELYKSIEFEDNSYKMAFGRKRDAKFPKADFKDLREDLESSFNQGRSRPWFRIRRLHQLR